MSLWTESQASPTLRDRGNNGRTSNTLGVLGSIIVIADQMMFISCFMRIAASMDFACTLELAHSIKYVLHDPVPTASMLSVS